MTFPLTTVQPDAPIESLFDLSRQGHIAIVCDGERFVGLITRIDVTKYLRKQIR